jgi:hypothetical protein
MNKERLLLLGFFALLVMPVVLILVVIPRLRRASESDKCLGKLLVISKAGKAWAEGNDGRFPDSFLSMTNQLGSPAFLICPQDRYRQPATDWAYFSPVRSSYIIAAPGLEVRDTNQPFVRCSRHGYLGYADETVFDGTRRRTIQ